MKRLRLRMFLAVLVVTTLGVQAVHAVCPKSYTLYFESGSWTSCVLKSEGNGVCNYSCTSGGLHTA
jgi:hypothetical protein